MHQWISSFFQFDKSFLFILNLINTWNIPVKTSMKKKDESPQLQCTGQHSLRTNVMVIESKPNWKNENIIRCEISFSYLLYIVVIVCLPIIWSIYPLNRSNLYVFVVNIHPLFTFPSLSILLCSGFFCDVYCAVPFWLNPIHKCM